MRTYIEDISFGRDLWKHLSQDPGNLGWHSNSVGHHQILGLTFNQSTTMKACIVVSKESILIRDREVTTYAVRHLVIALSFYIFFLQDSMKPVSQMCPIIYFVSKEADATGNHDAC